MDFAKAFDTVPHKRLLLKLKAYGITGKLLEWIEAFLKGRRQRVIQGEAVSEWREIFSGVPQGSVIGPILFVIFINDLPEKFKNTSKLYADDSKILNKVQYEEDRILIQDDLDTAVKWSKDWLVNFNKDKCLVMHYGSNNSMHDYSIDEFILGKTAVEKDLGIIFTSNLAFCFVLQLQKFI